MVESGQMSSIAPIYRHEDLRTRSIAVLISLTLTSIAYLFSSPCSAYTPVVNHRAIAGLWKLKQTPTLSSLPYPLKEFTVYPKVPKERNSNENKSKEVLLMLKEDGSFQQYSEQEQKVPDKLRCFNNHKTNEKSKDIAILDRYCEFGKLRGKWNLVGGKLVLAADRPTGEDGRTSLVPKTNDDIADTILEGEVVATTEEGLLDNPVLSSHNDDPQRDDDGNVGANSIDAPAVHHNDAERICVDDNNRSSILDTHLSVPKGQVNVGRFTYPQHHPSFFEAPMFNPRVGGEFELKQVLGTLNTKQQNDDELFEEKFSTSDFYDMTFLLTSQPIPEFQPKGNIRWSIKYNKFVEDPPPKSKKQKYEERMMDQPVHSIRVLEVKFFANNTFATIGGMGGSAILRGRFSIIGEDKDHIWMQVLRFGFGRSVSGSVFSEGKSLTMDDEKAYWGKIEYAGDQLTDGGENSEYRESNNSRMISDPKMDDSDAKEGSDRRLVVAGSVLLGFGLEPMPVGQFVLSETNSIEAYDEDDEDDDDDDEKNDGFNDDSFLFDSDDIFQ